MDVKSNVNGAVFSSAKVASCPVDPWASSDSESSEKAMAGAAKVKPWSR